MKLGPLLPGTSQVLRKLPGTWDPLSKYLFNEGNFTFGRCYKVKLKMSFKRICSWFIEFCLLESPCEVKASGHLHSKLVSWGHLIWFGVLFFSLLTWLDISTLKLNSENSSVQALVISLGLCNWANQLTSETQFPPLLNGSDNDPEIYMCVQLWKHLTWCLERSRYSTNVSFMYFNEWELRNTFHVAQDVSLFITWIWVTVIIYQSSLSVSSFYFKC